MKRTFLNSIAGVSILGLCIVLFLCCNWAKPKVLVFAKTAGFHHSSIPAGIKAIQRLGAENGFDVDTTTNAAMFSESKLKAYAAVIFLNTTGDVLDNYQEADFERYIQAGGGFVGIHAASDTEYGWGWYARLVGANFMSHPAPQKATLSIVDKNHPATKDLPAEWTRTDEWYNFKRLNPDVKVLIKINESSYEGGKNGADHPMAWYHDYDGGRAFYTELGHTDESYADPLYLKHILGGIKYAIDGNSGLDYSKAKTQRVPEENRFVKTMLTQGGFFEPTEMAVLPDLSILVTQRRGELMMYNAKTKALKQVGYLNVYHKANVPNVNSEEGLLGITADPDFGTNHFIYLYYSPAGDKSVDRLSRFEFRNDTLVNSSEKMILEVGTQRDICCHTGGSLAFGKGNVLFVSAGDNSTPFDESGEKYPTHSFGPLDDRPGHEQYDARRSAGNTNDLRGKILRIKINPDGTYDIPEGNLFPKGTAKTRPEIYVMGNRNPYRISVDKNTGFLYWGEVGPDATNDSLETRGPRGYDEVNQAKKAGNFGWPLFVGNNYAYHPHNYDNNKNGPAFDPAKPVNNSRNNTGLTELPPAQPAYIWYPYAASPEFPELGGGGRTAMAGPVYHVADYPAATRYPAYYNGKFFIYDFIRGWIKAVSQTPTGELDKIEPFMADKKFNSMIDMEAGPDGRIYVLEYGNGWFQRNPDAGIARLDYLGGNRPPEVGKLTVSKTSGSLPFTFTARVKATDPEKDQLTYVWNVGSIKKVTKVPQLTQVLTKAGEYEVSVTVVDSKKATATSASETVYAGNAAPVVNINMGTNRSFYFEGKPVRYSVSVTDKGSPVDMANLYVSTDYLKGADKAGANLGHQTIQAEMAGKNLMLTLDCKACHKENETSIGPAFVKVAQKYKNSADADVHLVNKIIKGGSGVWGEVAMPAHPTLKEEDAKLIVGWIRSLGNENRPQSLPAKGVIVPNQTELQQNNTLFALRANYTDGGASGVRPLSGTALVTLRNNLITADEFTNLTGFEKRESDGKKSVVLNKAAGSFVIGKFDQNGVKSVDLLLSDETPNASSYTVTVYGGKGGPKIGSGIIKKGMATSKWMSIPLTRVSVSTVRNFYVEIKKVGTDASTVSIRSAKFNAL